MNLANLNEPSILGFAITPWLIVLFVSSIGIIISLILIMSALAKRNRKEIELIEKAAANTSRIPVKDIDITSLILNSQTGNETEAFSYTEETDTKTESDMADATEGFDIGTEGFSIDAEQTEGLQIGGETESFAVDEQTEGLDMSTTYFGDKTQGLSESDLNYDTENITKAKFCAQCGSKVTGKGNFCSHCGSKIV